MNKKELDEIFNDDYYKELLEEVLPILNGEMTQEEFFGEVEEEKEEYSFPSVMEMKDEKQEVLEDTCNKLVEMLKTKIKEEEKEDDIQQVDLLTKEDISRMFKCENDKSLKIMRLLFEMRYATKIGKEYYIKKEDFEKFFNEEKGRKVIL